MSQEEEKGIKRTETGTKVVSEGASAWGESPRLMHEEGKHSGIIAVPDI
jgi:hypothetical protein